MNQTFLYNGHDSIGRKFPTTTRVRSNWIGGRYSSWECQRRLVWWWNKNYRDESVDRDRRARMSLLRTRYLQTHELRIVQSIQRHFDRPLTGISFTSLMRRDTSAIKVRLSSNWSLVHFVSRQNSFPTSAICPVRRQTTVGVPLYEMNFSYS